MVHIQRTHFNRTVCSKPRQCSMWKQAYNFWILIWRKSRIKRRDAICSNTVAVSRVQDAVNVMTLIRLEHPVQMGLLQNVHALAILPGTRRWWRTALSSQVLLNNYQGCRRPAPLENGPKWQTALQATGLCVHNMDPSHVDCQDARSIFVCGIKEVRAVKRMLYTLLFTSQPQAAVPKSNTSQRFMGFDLSTRACKWNVSSGCAECSIKCNRLIIIV